MLRVNMLDVPEPLFKIHFIYLMQSGYYIGPITVQTTHNMGKSTCRSVYVNASKFVGACVVRGHIIIASDRCETSATFFDLITRSLAPNY